MNTELKRVLFKLDDFCNANQIAYIVTGTVALDILGCLPEGYEPKDIDIKIINPKDKQNEALQNLDKLADIQEADKYEGYTPCVAFKVGKYKVNAFIYDIPDFYTAPEDRYIPFININFSDELDEFAKCRRLISVETALNVIETKKQLSRSKDLHFVHNLINKLSKF